MGRGAWASSALDVRCPGVCEAVTLERHLMRMPRQARRVDLKSKKPPEGGFLLAAVL
jgi:hypothetical protein